MPNLSEQEGEDMLKATPRFTGTSTEVLRDSFRGVWQSGWLARASYGQEATFKAWMETAECERDEYREQLKKAERLLERWQTGGDRIPIDRDTVRFLVRGDGES